MKNVDVKYKNHQAFKPLTILSNNKFVFLEYFISKSYDQKEETGL